MTSRTRRTTRTDGARGRDPLSPRLRRGSLALLLALPSILGCDRTAARPRAPEVQRAVAPAPSSQIDLPPGARARLGTHAFRHVLSKRPHFMPSSQGAGLVVAVSPDDRWIATASYWEKTVRVFARATGRCSWTIPCERRSNHVAFSPAGSLLAITDQRGGVRLFDVRRKRLVRKLQTRSSSSCADPAGCDKRFGYAYMTRFSHDGKLLATASWGKVYLWETASGRLLRTLDAPQDRVEHVAFSPDGSLLAAAQTRGTLRVWHVESGAARFVREKAAKKAVAVVFLGNSQLLLVGAPSPSFWNAATGSRIARSLPPAAKGPFRALAAAYSPATSLLALGGSALAIWDMKSGKLRHRLAGHVRGTCSVAFTADGKTLVSGGYDDMVRLWRAGREVRPAPSHGGAVHALAISPSSELLAASGRDGEIQVWSARSYDLLTTLPSRGDPVDAIAFVTATRIAAGAGKWVHVWDLERGARGALSKPAKPLLRLGPHTYDDVSLLAVSRGGKALASGGPYRVLLWTLPSGKLVRKYAFGLTEGITFARDGKLVALRVDNNESVAWQLPAKGAPRRSWAGSARDGRTSAFSPDGSTLALAGSDLRLLQASSGRLLAKAERAPAGVVSLAVSHDSRRLIAGCKDGTVRLFEVSSGAKNKPRSLRLIRSFKGHRSRVMAVAFFPDGRRAASGSDDHTVLIWKIPPRR